MADDLRAIIASCKKAADDARNVLKLLKRIETLNESRDQNALELRKALESLERQLARASVPPNVGQEVRTWASSFRQEIQRVLERSRQRFGLELERLLSGHGWKLQGHMPDLKVLFYTLEVDDAKDQVRIWFGPKQELLARSRLSPEEATKRLVQVNKEIAERSFDEQRFIRNLHSAYEMVLARRDLRQGDRAPITEVLCHLSFLLQDRRFQTDPRRDYYQGYSRAQFAYDLFRLKQRKFLDMELALGTATRAYTGNRRDFLWVPSDQSGNGTVYAHVLFKQVGPKETP